MVLYTGIGKTRDEATSKLYDSLPREAQDTELSIRVKPMKDGYQASCSYGADAKVGVSGGGAAPSLLEQRLNEKI